MISILNKKIKIYNISSGNYSELNSLSNPSKILVDKLHKLNDSNNVINLLY